jgi:hypothetical protein
MSLQWIRIWLDMPTDPKFRTISRLSKQPLSSVISLFVCMMTDCANATERGRTHTNDEDFASMLDLDVEQVSAIRKAMQGRVLDGNLLIGWEKRQPIREDNSAERSKAWREKKKDEKETNATERNRTQGDAPDTDTDTDSDTELRESVCNAHEENDFVELEKKASDELTPGFICRKLTEMGVAKTNPSNPKLLAALKQGATMADFMFAGSLSLDKENPFNYALGTVAGVLKEKQKSQNTTPDKVNGSGPNSNVNSNYGKNYDTKRHNNEAHSQPGRKLNPVEKIEAATRRLEERLERERGDRAKSIN